MKGFDRRQILKNCGADAPLLDGVDGAILQSGKLGVESFLKTLPHMYTACDRGFYFCIVTLDYDFRECAPAQQNKKTFFGLSKPATCKTVETACGRNIELPIIRGMINVNRRLFPPLDRGEDLNVWRQLMTDRKRQIAHELIYAEQFSKLYDATIGKWDSVYLRPPTEEEEEQLLCCDHDIEIELAGVEQIDGSQITDESSYEEFAQSPAGARYFKNWLDNHCVERSVAHRRTLDYVRTAQRSRHKEVTLDAIKECEKVTGIGFQNKPEFQDHAEKKTDAYRWYLSYWDKLGFKISEGLICHITHKHLRR